MASPPWAADPVPAPTQAPSSQPSIAGRRQSTSNIDHAGCWKSCGNAPHLRGASVPSLQQSLDMAAASKKKRPVYTQVDTSQYPLLEQKRAAEANRVLPNPRGSGPAPIVFPVRAEQYTYGRGGGGGGSSPQTAAGSFYTTANSNYGAARPQAHHIPGAYVHRQ
eukprot:GHVU01133212.1.p2 GENE.GHVU01133212.1~~GHVU01133212.1.p2  ORF type:complete len:164 (+),score=15.16 GHVU01133212.1:101-592(+)